MKASDVLSFALRSVIDSILRSARLHNARQTWHVAAVGVPPGMTNECNGGSELCSRSISFSRPATSEAETVDCEKPANSFPIRNSRHCISEMKSLSRPSSITDVSRPRYELSSSIVPYNSIRQSVFNTDRM